MLHMQENCQKTFALLQNTEGNVSFLSPPQRGAKQKLLASAFVITHPLPLRCPSSSSSAQQNLLLELGSAGFLPAACSELWAELYIADFSLWTSCIPRPLSLPSLSSPSPPICQWIVRHHSPLTSQQTAQGILCLRTDRQESDVLNSPLASNEFHGDYSFSHAFQE